MKIHERRQIAPVVGRLVHPISPSRRERITAALRSYSPLGLMGRRPSGGAGSSTEEPVIVQGHVIEGAAHLGIGDDLLELLLHASSNNDRSGL